MAPKPKLSRKEIEHKLDLLESALPEDQKLGILIRNKLLKIYPWNSTS